VPVPQRTGVYCLLDIRIEYAQIRPLSHRYPSSVGQARKGGRPFRHPPAQLREPESPLDGVSPHGARSERERTDFAVDHRRIGADNQIH
jgi:hypothetical protein